MELTQSRRGVAFLVAGMLGAGFVAGGVVVGAIMAFGSSTPETEPQALVSAEPLALLNTATVLFPVPPRDAGAIDDQRLEFAMHLAEVPPATWVVTDLVDVHIGPGTGYDFVAILLPGTEVVVDGEVGPWRRIADDGGYVPATHLRAPDAEAPPVLSYAVTGSGVLGDAGGCGGGVSLYEPITEEIGHPYWLVNSYCGGEPLAELAVGDAVEVDGTLYHVGALYSFDLLGSTYNFELVDGGLQGDAFIHTDNLVNQTALVVGLTLGG